MKELILEYLNERKERQFTFLKHLVLQPSYTKNLPGCNAVANAIIDALSASCMSVTEFQPKNNGKHLIFRSPACNHHEKSLLLVGHMDTVFPLDSGFDYFKRRDGIVRGPGVIDMKGGLVVAIFALKALGQFGLLDKYPITFICNSDEETGSLSSTELIKAEAERSFAGLVFECGGLNGEIVTGRKGRAGYKINVHGKAGHAAFAGRNKASAILELANKIIAIEKINDPQKQLVANVGVISGGIGPNTVPELASASIDTRFLTNEDYLFSRKAIDEIVNNCQVPGTSAELEVVSSRPPMEQSEGNKKLFLEIEKIAKDFDISVKEELRSGVSDANTIADSGVPVIDGLGPIGDLDHSDKEYMLEKSLLSRTKLATFAIPHICESYLNS